MRKKFSILGTIAFALLFIIPLSAPAATRSLVLGMSGADVTDLQNKLIAKGYLAAGKNTGYFGALTDAALKKFQCDKAIICSGASVSGYGVDGPKTQAALAGPDITGTLAQQNNITAVTPAATGKFEFSGWLPYWRVATGTADVIPHLSQLASVMPFSYTVDADGTLQDDAHLAQEPWPSFIALAQKAGIRIVPSILWGDGDAIQNVLSNTNSRIALEDSIADVVKRNNFDGIDIDFEAKKSDTIDYFSTFLKGLYQRMGNKWVYCTVEARMPLFDRYLPGTSIPDDAIDYANDYTQMNKYCDRVEIMAYDQGTVDVRLNNARTAPYAPVADPGWVEDLVNLAAQTISRNKLILGIPTYGYEYTVTPLASGFQYTRLWPFNPRYATDIAAQLGITPSRTSAGELGFIYDSKTLPAPSDGDITQTQQQSTATTTVAQNTGSQVNTSQPFNYVTWSDAQAIADKVALARKLGVRGVAVFKLDGGEDPGMWNALK